MMLTLSGRKARPLDHTSSGHPGALYPEETGEAVVTHRDMSSSPSRPRDTPLQRFGAILRYYRQQRHLSQRALAVRTGIRRAYISQIETGLRNIAVLTLLRLAYALEIPAASLLAGLDLHATLAPPGVCDLPPPRGARDAAVPYDDTPSLKPGDQALLLPLLGATIRQYRQQRGLFQVALATMTGLSPSHICQIEQGHRSVSVLNLVSIATALGLSVSSLLAPLDTYQASDVLPRKDTNEE
jgi:transcriptional regulator with XRE-family HTH domain